MSSLPTKILVLDDDVGVVTLLRRTLERAGYQVVGVSSPAAAAEVLEKDDAGVGLIILDYSLSDGGTEVSGLEFFRTMSAKGAMPPSILATGFSDEQRVLEALRAGVRDVVRKGDDFLDVLPRSVARVLREVDTERKAMEAEAASRAKDHFLAVLSHELRTPLTPVLTIAQEKERDPTLSADVREAFATIRRNIQLEARLIDDLLDLTRISRGKLELYLEPIDLHEKIAAVVRMCESEAQGKGLRIKLELNARSTSVKADPTRLAQVVWNLLRNALKFTPAGGAVTIRTTDGSDGTVVTEVSDTGIGIGAEALPKVFDAFEQGDRFITRQFGGLGLGLAITKALVGLHGGIIEAQSAGLGHGATFRFSVLASKMAAVSTDEQTGTPVVPEKAKLSILLVEDHADTAKVLSRLLRTLGHTVRTADTVAAALSEVESTEFDLLISDIGLPDGSGLDLMRQVRSKRPLRGIVLSGFGMEDDVNRSREAGFVAHLTKPVSFAHLEATIAKVAGMQVAAGA